MESCLYVGKLYHKRFMPIVHEFTYPVYMINIELNQLQRIISSLRKVEIEKANWLHFRRKDYCGESTRPLLDCVRELCQLETSSSIFLLSNFACWGYCFNPLSVYFVQDENGCRPCLLEVHNTPWGQRHCYPLGVLQPSGAIFQTTLNKAMHVSPFMKMDYQYAFECTLGETSLRLKLENQRDQKTDFLATLTCEAKPLTDENIQKILWKHPAITQRNIFAIYWQALKLKFKGVPFYPNPHSPLQKE